MENKHKIIAGALFTAGLISGFLNAVNSADAANVNTDVKTVISQNKEQMKMNREGIKENRMALNWQYQSQHKQIFDHIETLSEDEKTKLKALFEAHRLEMEEFKKSEWLPREANDWTTAEEKQVILDKMKEKHTAFIAEIKAITSNEEVLNFIDNMEIMMVENNAIRNENKNIRMENKEIRGENKDIRMENKEWKKENMEKTMKNTENKAEMKKQGLNISVEGKAKVEEFYVSFKDKFATKLDALSVDKLEQLNKTIDTYMKKASKESTIVYQLMALKKLINDKLSEDIENLNIESLLDL